MTGQEKLPVLRLADGAYVTGSKNSIAWAQENAPIRTA